MKADNKILRYIPFAGIACVCALSINAAHAVVNYTITDLGTLGGRDARAFAINDNAQVVGTSWNATYSPNAFRWSNGTMFNLGTLGGLTSGAGDINNSGTIVGSSSLAGAGGSGFIWRNGVMTQLGGLANDYSVAQGINNSNQIVGQTTIDTGAGNTSYRAFIWENNLMRDLGTLGGNFSSAAAINNNGQVVGNSKGNNLAEHAFVWDNGVMTDLGTLEGLDPGGFSKSWANDINDTGVVVGQSNTNGSYNFNAVIWDNNTIINMGTLQGDGESNATAINASGQVVGVSDFYYDNGDYTYTLGGAAFIWENDSMTNINSLIAADSGWVLYGATDINDAGQIIGYGSLDGTTATRAFLLSPVPVPAAVWLFGSGLLGFISVARRKKN